MIISCTKTPEPSPVAVLSTGSQSGTVFSTENKTLVYQGDFSGSAHPTSGKASVYKDSAGKFFLLLNDLKTDSGPDLRLYLAKDKNAGGFIELSKGVSPGNTVYELPAGTDISQKMNVLVWCKLFAVLFGSAELQIP